MKNFVTVGTMDGVHRGHAFIIGELARLARDARMKSLVLFFDYPPKAVLRGALFQSMITTPDERRALILKAGADKAECEHFTPELAVRSHEYFFSLLLSKYNMGGLLIGKDFAFGKDRMGHLDFLRAQCLAHGIPLVIDDFCREDGHKISSSVIRKLLSEGHVGAAMRFLGRPYNLSGPVVHGQGLGRTLGFPTANVDADPFKIFPHGVYAVRVTVPGFEGKVFGGVANIGIRPTVHASHTGVSIIEVHILDFSHQIYGRKISVDFISKIRSEKKFPSVEELKASLTLDAAEAARILSSGRR